MAIDPVSISAIVVSGITAISAAIAALHIKRMNSGCLDCDCTPSTPFSRSPTVSKPPVIIHTLQPAPLNIPNSNGQTVEKSTTSSEV